jgi:prepilin-type processing-associated H-X9-DG protein
MVAAGMTDACIKIWQNKHLGKGNLLFCDGHGEFRFMGDSTSAGETVGTGSVGTCFTVRGMWTRVAGD